MLSVCKAGSRGHQNVSAMKEKGQRSYATVFQSWFIIQQSLRFTGVLTGKYPWEGKGEVENNGVSVEASIKAKKHCKWAHSLFVPALTSTCQSGFGYRKS